MTTLDRRSTTRWLTAATFLTLAGASLSASAGKLTPPSLASNPIVSPTVVDDGQLKTTAPVLGSRSSKPSGGFVLNPVCVTAKEVVVGTAQYQHSKWRIVCPDDGKAIVNGSAYTTEDKLMVTQRGGLSPATVSLRFAGGNGVAPFTRVLCYAKLAGGQTLPGVMEVPAKGTLPGVCRAKVMGTWVAFDDWGVFKYASSGLASTDGWWSPGASWSTTTTDLPLYSYAPPKREVLCRAKDPNSALFLPGELVQSGTGRSCRVFGSSSGFTTVSSFEIYVAHTQNSHPFVPTVAKTKANWSWSTGVLVHDGGSDATRVYACTVPNFDRIGWVKRSEGICRTGDKTATSFKLLTK